ncbi:MAG: hypothetical protein AB7N65_24850 [Vicinamibacterales bacterium]
MALKLSTGAAKKVMDTNPFKTVFNLCFIDIYSGTRPNDPDEAVPGDAVKLATISNNGTATGLTFEAAATAGELEKNASEVWSEDAVIATGSAAWFRMREAGTTGLGASTTEARIDGSIATSGADLNLPTTSLVAGIPFTIQSAAFTLPRGV